MNVRHSPTAGCSPIKTGTSSRRKKKTHRTSSLFTRLFIHSCVSSATTPVNMTDDEKRLCHVFVRNEHAFPVFAHVAVFTLIICRTLCHAAFSQSSQFLDINQSFKTCNAPGLRRRWLRPLTQRQRPGISRYFGRLPVKPSIVGTAPQSLDVGHCQAQRERERERTADRERERKREREITRRNYPAVMADRRSSRSVAWLYRSRSGWGFDVSDWCAGSFS